MFCGFDHGRPRPAPEQPFSSSLFAFRNAVIRRGARYHTRYAARRDRRCQRTPQRLRPPAVGAARFRASSRKRQTDGKGYGRAARTLHELRVAGPVARRQAACQPRGRAARSERNAGRRVSCSKFSCRFQESREGSGGHRFSAKPLGLRVSRREAATRSCGGGGDGGGGGRPAAARAASPGARPRLPAETFPTIARVPRAPRRSRSSARGSRIRPGISRAREERRDGGRFSARGAAGAPRSTS